MTVPDPVAEPTDAVDPVDEVGPIDEVDPEAVADTQTEPSTTAEPEAEVESDQDGTAAAPGAADFRLALVSSVTLDLPSQYPSVVLRELDMPRRQLTFSIGMSDAVALSHAFRRMPTPRPLTHELLSEVLQRFDVDVVAVRIV